MLVLGSTAAGGKRVCKDPGKSGCIPAERVAGKLRLEQVPSGILVDKVESKVNYLGI